MSETISKSQYARLPSFKTMSESDLAVVSKLVKQNDVGGPRGRNRQMEMADMSMLGKIAGKTANNNNDAKNLFQMLPDMDLARSILVSAILSPTDLVTTQLLYSLESNSLDDNLTGPMLRVIKDYFDNTYKIKKFLPDMLSDALFMKGAYPLLVMPETSIDYSINSSSKVTLESFKGEITKEGWYRPYGVLGLPDKEGNYKVSVENLWDYSAPTFENADKESFSVFKGFRASTESTKVSQLAGKVYVTDNPSILSNPRLLDRLRKQRQSEVYGRRTRMSGMPSGTTTGMESAADLAAKTKLTLDKTEKLFYINRQSEQTPLQSILTPKQLVKKNASHPLVMHLPSEAVIPVHVPGNVRQHIGYFVLLDINGNPLTIEYSDDFYSDIRASLNSDPAMSSQLLNMARRNTTGSSNWGAGEIDHMQRAYQNAVETDLLNRLRSGAVTGEYELANCEEVYRLMFSRSLAAKNTMLLYVPAELMTYITFDYNEYGVGKSLLEDGKILGSLRSVLLFASTMAAVKNSVDGRNINITVPEEDEDPYGTVAFMLGEYAKINRSGFPIGETHPVQLVTHLQNAGTVISVQGNTAFPDAKFDVESRDNGHKVLDRDLDEDLRRRHIQTFGLTPETMEAASGADFATTVVNQHMMLLKRVIQYQEEFTPFLTDFVRRYTLNSGPLFDEMLKIVTDNKKHLPTEYKDSSEDFVLDFIDLICIELPSPETNRLEDQMRGYDTYTEAVTKAVDAYLSSESLDPIASQGLEEHLDAIKASLISMYQRRYLREKNILPELDIFNTVAEEDGPAFNLLEETQEHLDGVLSSVEGYIKKMLSEAKKRAKRMEKQQAEINAISEGGGDGDGDGDEGMGLDDEGGFGELSDDGAGDTAGAGADDDFDDDLGDLGGGESDDLGFDDEQQSEPDDQSESDPVVEDPDAGTDPLAAVEGEEGEDENADAVEEEEIDLEIPDTPKETDSEEEVEETEEEIDLEIPDELSPEEEEDEDKKDKS
jgi:hypothetical protein